MSTKAEFGKLDSCCFLLVNKNICRVSFISHKDWQCLHWDSHSASSLESFQQHSMLSLLCVLPGIFDYLKQLITTLSQAVQDQWSYGSCHVYLLSSTLFCNLKPAYGPVSDLPSLRTDVNDHCLNLLCCRADVPCLECSFLHVVV